MGDDTMDKAGTARQEPKDAAISRRDVMRLGLATLAGMGVSAVAAPVPAFGAGGEAFILGQYNSSGLNGSSLDSTTSGCTLNITNSNSSDGQVLYCSQNNTSASQAAQIRGNTRVAALLVENQYTGVPLSILPKAYAGPPSTGYARRGDMMVDSNGVVWHCIAPGTIVPSQPGTWVPVRSTVPLGTPRRVIDTRKGTGGITGRLVKKKVYTFPSFLAAAGIPQQAIAVIGNLTMVAPEGLKAGAWMAIVPAVYNNGVTMPPGYPGVSTVNSVPSDAIANQFTCSLGSGGHPGQVSIMWDGTSTVQPYAVVDITGYII
jgi:hypothetical protein